MNIETLGIDVGKNVFHAVGLDATGQVVLRRKFTRSALMRFIGKLTHCRVGMEACSGSQHLGRRFERFGHTVRLMAAQFVKPYVKSNKSDFNELSDRLRALIDQLWQQISELEAHIAMLNAEIEAIAAADAPCQRLLSIPGIGVLTASAMVATIGDAKQFRCGRELAAYLGLVPRQYSTGGRPRLLGISKRGNTYLRMLLIHGARAVLRGADKRSDRLGPWLRELKARRPSNVTAVALANTSSPASPGRCWCTARPTGPAWAWSRPPESALQALAQAPNPERTEEITIG